MKIEVVHGDITKSQVEAIVNAANNEFWMGSGVAGAIKSAGGEIIEKEAVKKGPAMPGDAIHTTAGSLPYKVIIHAAVMGQDRRTNDRYIRQATISSLNICEQLKLQSVSFPAFGTGVGGFPMKACANIMVKTVNGYESIAKSLDRVQFCLFDKLGFELFKQAAEQLSNR